MASILSDRPLRDKTVLSFGTHLLAPLLRAQCFPANTPTGLCLPSLMITHAPLPLLLRVDALRVSRRGGFVVGSSALRGFMKYFFYFYFFRVPSNSATKKTRTLIMEERKPRRQGMKGDSQLVKNWNKCKFIYNAYAYLFDGLQILSARRWWSRRRKRPRRWSRRARQG